MLVYEVMHNLVVEVTRASIEVKNMKMRVESIASRLEFNERRARALEAVVQYRPDAERGRDHDRDRDRDRERRGRRVAPAEPAPCTSPPPGPVDPLTGGDSLRSRRKRRRRGRRSGPGFGDGRPSGRSARSFATWSLGEPRSRMSLRGRRPGRQARGLKPRPPEARGLRRPSPSRPASVRVVRLAVVVQRYGADINGGAELHARYVAEHLARHAEVEVFTTCARDYVTWANELPAGAVAQGGVLVRRFPVSAPRDVFDFARRSTLVFNRTHSVQDELAWLDSEGPTSPALISALTAEQARFDWIVVFSYRYHHAFHSVRAVAPKAVLVPTAERDAAVGLSIFGPIFRGVRALMFNSFEERAMLQHAAGRDLPGVVVGVGSDVPERPRARPLPRRSTASRARLRSTSDASTRTRAASELFEFFQRFERTHAGPAARWC